MQLFGFKTEAMLDLWSLEHFANGVAMAAIADLISVKILPRVFKTGALSPAIRRTLSFVMVLVIALFWEVAEHYVEAGVLPGTVGAAVTYWFAGIEHWSNRLIGDNLMVMLGWYVYDRRHEKNKWLPQIFKIFTTIWMLAHIFFFDNSMAFQQFITGHLSWAEAVAPWFR
jgi:hypothetical protein